MNQQSYSNDTLSSDYDNGSGMNTSALASSARELAQHAQELLDSTASVSSEGLSAIRAKLNKSLDAAKEQLAKAQEFAKTRGKAAAESADNYVHEKPWQAVTAAALAGVMLGYMSSGSRRH